MTPPQNQKPLWNRQPNFTEKIGDEELIAEIKRLRAVSKRDRATILEAIEYAWSNVKKLDFENLDKSGLVICIGLGFDSITRAVKQTEPVKDGTGNGLDDILLVRAEREKPE